MKQSWYIKVNNYSKKYTFPTYSDTINFAQIRSSIKMKVNLVQNYLKVPFPE